MKRVAGLVEMIAALAITLGIWAVLSTAAPKSESKECLDWHQYLFYHYIDSIREQADLTHSDPPSYSGSTKCPEYLTNLTKKDLRIVRNAVYARHGRPFKSKDLQEFFYKQNKKRFKMNPNYKDSMLTKIDKANITYIQGLEKKAK